MPRVPTSDAAPIAQTGVQPQYTNFNFADGTAALNAGIGEASQAVGNVQAFNAEKAKKAKDRADAAAVDSLFAQAQDYTTNQLHGYDEAPKPKAGPAGYDTLTEDDIASVGAPGEHQKGFLDTRGSEAYEKAGDVTEALSKKYDSLVAAAGNQTQRTLFQNRLNQLKASAHLQIAEHEGQQRRVVEVAATNGLLDTSLRSASNLYDQPKEWRPFVKDALDSLQRSSLPEEFEAKKADYLSKVSQTVISGYLEHGDIAGAQRQFKADSDTLGPDGAAVKARIDQALKVQQRAAIDIEGEKLAAKMVGEATSPTGKVDEAKALAAVDKIPEGPLRDEARQRLHQRITAVTAAYKEDTDTISKAAFGAFNTGGWSGIPPGLKTSLNERNPELYDKLKNEAERKWKARQGSKADERREQAAINKEALNDFMSLPTADRAKQDMKLFLADHPGVDQLGASALGPHKQNAAAVLEKAGAEQESEFVRQAVAARPVLKPGSENPLTKSGKATAAANDKAWRARATLAYQQFVLTHQKAPTDEEAAKLSVGLILFGQGSGSNQAEPADYAAATLPVSKRLDSKPAVAAKKLAPGRYKAKDGKVWVVDAQGNKTQE